MGGGAAAPAVFFARIFCDLVLSNPPKIVLSKGAFGTWINDFESSRGKISRLFFAFWPNLLDPNFVGVEFCKGGPFCVIFEPGASVDPIKEPKMTKKLTKKQ